MVPKYQKVPQFWIKVFALFAMALDHIGLFMVANYSDTTQVYQIGSILRIIGRLAFPLFVFFLAEGLRHTSDRKRYILRLFYMWAGIAVIQSILYSCYRYSTYTGYTSILSDLGSQMNAQAFTDLLLYALFVYLLENKNGKIRWLSVLPIIYILGCYALGVIDRYGFETTKYFPDFLRSSYNLFGFLIFLGFYYAYKLSDLWVKKGLKLEDETLEKYQQTPEYRRLVNVIGVTLFTIVVLVLWGLSYLNWHLDVYENPDTKIQNYCLLDAIILLCYSGSRGYDSKWFRYFEYFFYPVHIAIIAIVFTLILA